MEELEVDGSLNELEDKGLRLKNAYHSGMVRA